MNFHSRRAWLGAVALAAGIAAAPAWADDDEDCKAGGSLRLVNGKIHTMDKNDSIVSSVLIKNGRFAAVGHRRGDDGDDECARTINLRGRTVVPGIIDSHNHILLLGLRPGRDARLENANSIKEALATLAARVKEANLGEWVTSIGGFSGPGSTNKLGRDFFISKGIPVGDDGSVVGGAFFGATPCTMALFELRKLQTRDSMLQGLQDAMRYAAGIGVTTHLDQGGFPAVGDNTDGAAHFDRYRAHDSVRALYHEGKLTNRIWINFLHLEGNPETPELQARLLNSWDDFGNNMLRVLGIGEFTGGASFLIPGSTAWQNGTRLVALAGWRNENHSLNFPVPGDGRADWKVIIDGWQAVHDAVVKDGNPDGITKLRWVLAHVPFIDQEHLTRLKNLGGGINVLGGWRWLSGTATQNGPQFRLLLASGIPLGMSSDGMQISVMSPWINLYYVVTGKNALGQEIIKDIYSVLTIVNGTVVHDDLDGKSKAYWKAGLPTP